MAKLVKLGGAATMFRDPETGFGLMDGEVLSWPEAPGALTRQWANAGGLVVFEGDDVIPAEAGIQDPGSEEGRPAGSPVQNGEAPEEEPPVDVADQIIEKRVAELMDRHTVAQLKDLLKENGVAFHPREGAPKLATKLAVAEWTARRN